MEHYVLKYEKMCIKSLPQNAFAIFSKTRNIHYWIQKNEKSRAHTCAFEKYQDFTYRSKSQKKAIFRQIFEGVFHEEKKFKSL